MKSFSYFSVGYENLFKTIRSILCHYYIQNVKDGIQIRLCKISKEIVTHFSQFISVKVDKILRTPQARFLGKVKKIEACAK